VRLHVLPDHTWIEGRPHVTPQPTFEQAVRDLPSLLVDTFPKLDETTQKFVLTIGGFFLIAHLIGRSGGGK
jgi:hypothetical protein